MGKLPTEGEPAQRGRERKRPAHKRRGELPSTGEPAQKGGGGVERPAQREVPAQRGREREREKELPAEGEPAQKGGVEKSAHRGG